MTKTPIGKIKLSKVKFILSADNSVDIPFSAFTEVPSSATAYLTPNTGMVVIRTRPDNNFSIEAHIYDVTYNLPIYKGSSLDMRYYICRNVTARPMYTYYFDETDWPVGMYSEVGYSRSIELNRDIFELSFD